MGQSNVWVILTATPESRPPIMSRIARARLSPILIAAGLLAWPAAWNGYPLVFSDTGTYLSQALNRYLGWDRPVFYSFFMLPLHMGLTTWPVVAAQASLVAWVVHVALRALRPGSPARAIVPVAAALALTSPLPWFAAQLMPDLFTGLLILALTLLVLVPERIGRAERLGLGGLSAFAMEVHLSNLPVGLALLGILLPLRRRLGARAALSLLELRSVLLPPVVAVLMLMGVNWAGHGVPTLAPYGNIFLLARVIEDGPGRDALLRSCPAAGWRLCAVRDRLPATADAFLWRPDSPLNEAGGPKGVSVEASQIIAAAVRAEPGAELAAALRNGARQLVLFDSGDGLQPWPDSVTPWIRRDFPRFEQLAYAASRQTTGQIVLPAWMRVLHAVTAVGAALASLVLLPGLLYRREVLGGVVLAVLLGLVANAAVTGALSGPHARYQNRVMWLPVLAGLLAGAERWWPAAGRPGPGQSS